MIRFADVDDKTYWRCTQCAATVLDPAQRLTAAAEYEHYLHHENDPDDPGYRAFLSKVADPLRARLARASCGLDFGCGPGPALAAMLREAGHAVALYDPFFAPDPAPLQDRYDFVTCTEVAEHFHAPAAEFAKLHDLLNPQGWLAIMTRFQTDDDAFSTWYYRKDPTHTVFYRAETLRFLASQLDMECQFPCRDVALMRRW